MEMRYRQPKSLKYLFWIMLYSGFSLINMFTPVIFYSVTTMVITSELLHKSFTPIGYPDIASYALTGILMTIKSLGVYELIHRYLSTKLNQIENIR